MYGDVFRKKKKKKQLKAFIVQYGWYGMDVPVVFSCCLFAPLLLLHLSTVYTCGHMCPLVQGSLFITTHYSEEQCFPV